MNDMFTGLRKDFPYLADTQKKLIYLDSAATTQKPQQVITALDNFYCFQNAPVHRGVYTRAEQATEHYEQSRDSVARFIGASADEIIITGGTTASINFVAQAWAACALNREDEIIVTELEHHSNLVPWIRLSQEQGFRLRYVPITPEGTLDYQAYLQLLNSKTKLVSFTLTSNVLGSHTDARFMIEHAHAIGAKVLIDAAQTIAHQAINVHELKPDFLAFSAHKMLGPTGIGILYAARHMHASLEPYQVGGGMVFEVDKHKVTWLKPPHKYEAGTPPIAQAVGLAAAINYITEYIHFPELKKYEAQLCARLIAGLQEIPGIEILGPLAELAKSGHMVSFWHHTIHAHDIAAYLDRHGVAVRAGHQCAQVLHKQLGVTSSVRMSFYFYNTLSEVDYVLDLLKYITN